MIQKVSFRNFKAYRSLDLELEPFTVVVGPNASGKTTLLDGLALISSEVAGASNAESARLRSHGTDSPIALSLSGTWGDTTGLVTISGDQVALEGEERTGFGVSGQWGGAEFPQRSKLPFPQRSKPLVPKAFSDALRSTVVLRLEPRKLAEASYSEEMVPRMGPDGSGLASVLAYLKLSADEAFNEIEASLRQIVPAVRRIRIERASVEKPEQGYQLGTRTFWGNQIILDMKGARGLSVDAVGEGTLMALGLLTALKGPIRPRLALLDDIELALHPVAQARLVEVLRAIQASNTELQIVTTSHSPFILNYLEPREVRMTFLADDGFARCEKLTSHPDFEKWKDLMSPGEFWSTVGESWLEKVGETSASK